MVLRWLIARQFRKPEGLIGQLVGHFMATRPSNRQRAAWTVALLDIKPDDRVLEVGCGPGLGIADVAARLDNGFIIGIDHSEAMIDQAQLRNQTAIREGRVELSVRSMDTLPVVRDGFTKAFGINIVQFLPDLDSACAPLFDVLAPGGLLGLTYQPRLNHANRDDAISFGDRLAASFAHAGFVDIRMEELALKPAPAVCVLGRKPDETARKQKPNAPARR